MNRRNECTRIRRGSAIAPSGLSRARPGAAGGTGRGVHRKALHWTLHWTLLPALLWPSVPLLPLFATLAVTPAVTADENHPRWKQFVTWLMDKRRTPEEDLILRYILAGGSRFTWLDVYAHSMQEQTDALFVRWLEREGNPRRSHNLGTRPPGNSRG
jgi:hypothetical protein